MWGRGHWNICKWSPRGDTNFMGLEFSSANLNNQMWEQKNKPPHHCHYHHLTTTTAPYLQFQPPPQASSLFPPARSSHKLSTSKLLLGSPYGAGEGEGGGGVLVRKRRGLEETRRRASVPDQAELPVPDYDTIFSAGFPASSCFCEYGA